MARYAGDFTRERWGWGENRDWDRAGRGGYGYRGGYARGDRYDAGYRSYGRGYDRDYRDRWQTDFGDPYGDRSNRTPFRLIRGEFENREWNQDRWRGYDRDMYARRRYGGRYDRERW